MKTMRRSDQSLPVLPCVCANLPRAARAVTGMYYRELSENWRALTQNQDCSPQPESTTMNDRLPLPGSIFAPAASRSLASTSLVERDECLLWVIEKLLDSKKEGESSETPPF